MAVMLPGRPLLLGASNCVVSLYIYHLVCAASAECRASGDVAICRQSVSQSGSRWSRVKQSSRRRARSRTRRWSIVAVINKMINFNYEFIMFT